MQINFGNHVLPGEAQKHKFVGFNPGLLEQAKLVALSIEYLKVRSTYCNPIMCDEGFKSLPKHHTFDEVLNDKNVWISFGSDRGDLANGNTWLGLTINNDEKNYDIAINTWAFTCVKNKATRVQEIAAILVHEMAHVNGAPNDTHTAEMMLMFCGFGEYYEPTVIG